MKGYPKQFEIYRICLDPTVGSEYRKTRPCVVVSPNEMNRYIKTIIIAPMTTKIRENYPTKVKVNFQSTEQQVALDQIRTVDKNRLIEKLGNLPEDVGFQILDVLVEMFTRE